MKCIQETCRNDATLAGYEIYYPDDDDIVRRVVDWESFVPLCSECGEEMDNAGVVVVFTPNK